MNKATFGEVAQWVVSEYPDHGVDANDPGLGMLALFVRLSGFWVSGIEQDCVEHTINAVDGIVVRIIGRCVSGAFEVVAKAAETLAYLDGGALQQSLFKLLGITLVVTGLGDGLFQQRQRILFTVGCQAMAKLFESLL
ncbi:hypothetical protein ACTG13_08405 [Aeromonas hydrophila]|uniref:hypothetical protein n=1 Tax=Aeromonas hydrophila TaxID=644 RepID=UPI0007608DD2|nr:hypothetical protein ATO50_05270 [Aeromonas hydrophila]